MDNNTIQYQPRTDTLTDWEILCELPKLIDLSTLTNEQQEILSNFTQLRSSLQLLSSRKLTQDKIILVQRELNAPQFQIEKLKKDIEDTQDEINQALQKIKTFEQKNSAVLKSLVQIGLPVIEAQQREQDRIRFEEWHQRKYGTSAQSTTKNSIGNYPQNNSAKAIHTEAAKYVKFDPQVNIESVQTATKHQEEKQKQEERHQKISSIKEKLSATFGCFGIILFYAIRLIIAALPFMMISGNFFVRFLLIGIDYFFPLVSPIFWIWGLVCTIKGVQDFWAILYYIVFIIIWIPFYISTISTFLSNKK